MAEGYIFNRDFTDPAYLAISAIAFKISDSVFFLPASLRKH